MIEHFLINKKEKKKREKKGVKVPFTCVIETNKQTKNPIQYCALEKHTVVTIKDNLTEGHKCSISLSACVAPFVFK